MTPVKPVREKVSLRLHIPNRPSRFLFSGVGVPFLSFNRPYLVSGRQPSGSRLQYGDPYVASATAGNVPLETLSEL